MNQALDKFTSLMKKVDKAKEKASQAEGAILQLRKQLKEYGCSNLKEAKKHLNQIKTEAQDLDIQLQAMIDQFEQDWGEYLD